MREYLLVLFCTAAVTYLLTGPVRKFAIAAGAMPPVRARDVHREPTPRLGGIAMFGGLCAGILVASQLDNLSKVFTQGTDIRALLSGAGIMFLLGVLDDKWGVDALVKLGGQMIAAGVMVWQGVTVITLPVPGVGAVAVSPTQGMVISVTLVVVMVNAVNFIDGLDGLAGGMVCIAAMAFFLYSYRLWYGYAITDAAPAVLFSVLLIGMCLGFLAHNMHPARIFMGDSGSMMLGLMLAVAAISITGRVDPDLINNETGSQTATVHALVPIYIPLLLPLTVIALPLADLLLAVVRRQAAPAPPAAAGRALAQPGRADHVLLGRADRLRLGGLLGDQHRPHRGPDARRALPGRPGGAAHPAVPAAGAAGGAVLRPAAVPPPVLRPDGRTLGEGQANPG